MPTAQSLPGHDEILARVVPQREKWTAFRPKDAIVPGPGQESCWDFPRPPQVRDVSGRVEVDWQGDTIAATDTAKMVVETAGAPVYFIPPGDVKPGILVPKNRLSLCEWKGVAVYFDLAMNGKRKEDAAFAYPDPLTDLGQGYEAIAGWVAFYAGKVDAARVGGEAVTPQPGGFYAGWITSAVTGPFKGEPGSEHW
ncbi:MAG: DUF427 domain-containing protein [Alphaproteobacteria bacterium]